MRCLLKLNILCLLPNETSPLARIRLIDPLEAYIKKYPGNLRIQNVLNWEVTSDIGWADVIIFQREANLEIIALIIFLKKIKKKIIFDIDDLLTQVPAFLTTYHHALRTKKYLHKVLTICDAVTVTNKRLQNEFMKFNSNVVIIPNCSSIIGNDVLETGNDSVINLIIASSDTIQIDLMISVLKKLTLQTELEFNLIGIGPPGKLFEKAGLKIQVNENMSYEKFKKFLTSKKNAIGLIPLEDSKFSSCKSAIKFVDFSLSDVVSICSAVPPYSDVVINGKTGVLVNNDVESWYHAIMEVGKSNEFRLELARSAKDYCLKYFSIDRSAEKWQELFLSLNLGEQKLSKDYLLRQYRIYRTNLIVSHLLDKSSYLKALELVRKYGVVNFTKRFFKYFKLNKHS